MAGEPWDVIDALLAFLDRLEAADFPYAIGGSVASSAFGEPRTSTDSDVIVDLPRHRFEEFVHVLGSEFYVPRDTAALAVEARASFSVIHRPTSAKVDIFILGRSPLDRELFARRIHRPLLRDSAPVWLSSPEDMIVRKLDWFRRGDAASVHQWRDVLGILKVQAGRLDEPFMRRAAAELGVTDLLDRALRLQGPPPR